ncbi:MAG: response regulator transcription factor [Elusimicrobiota bacterium]|jgi:DNA-binding response OmpR family regulator
MENETGTPPPEVLKVLLIEDSPAEACTLRRFLETMGFDVSEAPDGTSGLSAARELVPDFIVLDLNLPDVTGFEVLQVLRVDPKTRDIPILCSTAEADPAGLLKTASLGLKAGGLLRKPFTGTELSEKVWDILRAKRSSEKGAEALRFLEKGALRIDLVSRTIWVGDRALPPLADKRFELLCALVRAKEPLSGEALFKEVWGGEQDGNIVAVTVQRLRRDLAGFPILRLLSTAEGYVLCV